MDANTRRQAVLDQKTLVSARLSSNCRAIGYGLIVFYIAVFFVDSEFTQLLWSGYTIYLIGAMGILTIVFDYLHYLAACWSVEAALARADHLYVLNSPAYTVRRYCFRVKQLTAIIGFIGLSLVLITEGMK